MGVSAKFSASAWCCAKYPTRSLPDLRVSPTALSSSPTMSLSKVDLPCPFAPNSARRSSVLAKITLQNRLNAISCLSLIKGQSGLANGSGAGIDRQSAPPTGRRRLATSQHFQAGLRLLGLDLIAKRSTKACIWARFASTLPGLLHPLPFGAPADAQNHHSHPHKA